MVFICTKSSMKYHLKIDVHLATLNMCLFYITQLKTLFIWNGAGKKKKRSWMGLTVAEQFQMALMVEWMTHAGNGPSLWIDRLLGSMWWEARIVIFLYCLKLSFLKLMSILSLLRIGFQIHHTNECNYTTTWQNDNTWYLMYLSKS